MFYSQILKYLLIFVFFAKIVNADTDIYSFKNIHIENESTNSYLAKEIIIKNTIDKKFTELSKNLIINIDQQNHKINNIKSEDFLKNIIVKNEIVTEKKYIADLDIIFNKSKIISFYKDNNVLFSDTLSPNFLILSTFNFDGTNILWENNNWNNSWSNFDSKQDQLTIILPNSDNINKILLSSYDIFNLNTINIEKIMKHYNLRNCLLISASKQYNADDGKLYVNLLITLYKSDNQSLENIYSEKIFINKLNNKDLLNYLTILSYENIFKWWKNKTITYFNKTNNISCKIIANDIEAINNIKNILLSISHVDNINIKSLNTKIIDLNINYFGELNEIINIFKISKLNMIFNSNECFLSYESI